MSGALSRRALLTGLAAGFALPLSAASAPRIVTTELILTETALALGLAPTAAGNVGLYRRLVAVPPLAPGAADLGPLDAPNMELLVWLAPDMILAADWQRAMQGGLERIAPVHWLPTLPLERPPLANGRTLAARIGELTGQGAAANAFLARMDERFAALSARLRALAPPPLRVARLMEDGRHAMIFAPGSLVDDVIVALGLVNAEGDSGGWGARLAGVDALAGGGPVLTLGPPGEGAILTALRQAGLRLIELPAVFPAGGVASALRLAEAIADGLERSA